MSVPKDQGLTLTIFSSVVVFFILLFWIFLPPNISFNEDNEEQAKVLKPDEAVFTAEQILTQAEESLTKLEKEAEEKKESSSEEEKKQ